MGAKIILDHVNKIYGKGDTAVKALKDVSLTVNEGEFVAVVGPSGSGKSTFLSIAGALLSPTSGKIYLGNQDITTCTSKELTDIRIRNIGFIFQTSNLLPYLTVVEQLLLVPKLVGKSSMKDEAKAKELLIQLGLSHRLNHHPDKLSGGERQRVAIARAFMNDPELILADEPTASLDSKRGREVVQMLSHEVKTRGKAAIMVTHDERVLDLCDRIVMIKDGALYEEKQENIAH